MTPQEIKEGNEKIARFMGWNQQNDDSKRWYGQWFNPITGERHNYLFFNLDWNWIMPVIQEIEQRTGWILVMASGYAYFTDGNGSEHEIGEMCGWQSIGNIYDCVIEFIDWYNSQNQ